ncbi:ComEC/Rec2 family competence protein [Agromyces intestinalis]|uniref:ComEC/Rec2 family competence protein n=1 Tax=Agromyces intestinalis TaxID=2592652 RepID=UPI00143D324B|nr:ComEC/Rec2 family competence protein [Agromyces intestinalis]
MRTPDLRLAWPALVAWAAAWTAPLVASSAGRAVVVAVTVAAWVVTGVLVAGAVAIGAAGLGRAPRRAPAETAAGRTDRGGRRGFVGAVPAVAVATAAAALAFHAAALGIGVRLDSPLAEAAVAHRTVDVVVELVRAPRASKSAPPWAVDDDSGEGRVVDVVIDGRAIAVDGRAVAAVTVSAVLADDERLAFGARIGFRARVEAQPAEEGTAFRLRAVGDDLDVASPPPWLAWAASLRAAFRDAAADLPGDGGALVPGLAIGDTAAVSDDLDAAMKASSLSHLTAVSGANCAIVTAAAFAIAAAAGLATRWRIVVALLALGAFVALVTPESSVVRATAMAVVVLLARASGRPGGGVAALSGAVVILLAADPWMARDYGFALSASATAGLLLLSRPLGGALARVMPRRIADVLAVPMAAQLACQPILILLDPGIAVHGVVANLLADPAAPIGTVIGMIGCLVLPVLPGVGTALLQVAWLPASWIAAVARGVAALPGARLPWLPDAIGALLLAAITGLTLWLVLVRRRRGWATAFGAGALAVLVAIPVGVTAGAPTLRSWSMPGDWQFAACDVGQGDAMLVRSAGAVALIDTGPDPAALSTCLGRLGIGHIDLLVLTHWDTDHVGGFEAVDGRVGTVLHGPLDGGRSSRVLGPLVAGGAESVEVVAGRSGRLGDDRWTVRWPEPDEPPGNDASVVIQLDAPGFRALFLGDLGEDAQRRMSRTADLPPVDVVKVAHHGSADQYPELYRSLGARVGLIGVGADNGYGHPTAKTVDLLADAGIAVVRTDRDGTSVLTIDERRDIRLWTERGEATSEADRTLGAAEREAREARWRLAPARRRPRRRSRSSGGTPFVRHPWCWCRAPKTCWPTARSRCCASSCAPKTPPSR